MNDGKLLNKILCLIELLKDDEARSMAYELAANNKVPLQKLQFWTAYMQGMRQAYETMFEKLLKCAPKKEKSYITAERNLCLSSYAACYDYHTGVYEIHYRNHVHDKKGNVAACEAYFVKQKNILEEVIYT